MRTCDSGLRPSAPGPVCCDLALRQNFPLPEGAILARPSFVAPGRTFSIHVARLEKACCILGIGATWRAKAVSTAGRGLTAAGDQSFKLRPSCVLGHSSSFKLSQSVIQAQSFKSFKISHSSSRNLAAF